MACVRTRMDSDCGDFFAYAVRKSNVHAMRRRRGSRRLKIGIYGGVACGLRWELHRGGFCRCRVRARTRCGSDTRCTFFVLTSFMVYPTAEQAAVVRAAEKLMEETMARYDPSHDAYHGTNRFSSTASTLTLPLIFLQFSASGRPHCLLLTPYRIRTPTSSSSNYRPCYTTFSTRNMSPPGTRPTHTRSSYPSSSQCLPTAILSRAGRRT